MDPSNNTLLFYDNCIRVKNRFERKIQKILLICENKDFLATKKFY